MTNVLADSKAHTKPSANTATTPGADNATKPSADTANKPGANTTTKPDADTAAKSGANTATKSGANTATKSGANTATKSGANTATKPGADTHSRSYADISAASATTQRTRRFCEKCWRTLYYVFVALSVLLIVSEGWLRIKGYTPYDANQNWQYKSYDSFLGWVNVPGHNKSTEGELTRIVFENVTDDGRRVSAPPTKPLQNQRVLLLGCSYTFGQGVADNETWAWKLGERFPHVTFDNYGVIAYGACQALGLAERLLATPRHYDWVLFVAMHDHHRRDTEIIHMIGDIRSTGPYVLSRRAQLDAQGHLCFLPCEPRWWGDNLLASVNYAKRIYYTSQIHLDASKNTEVVTQQVRTNLALWQRLSDLAHSHGSRFAVIALEPDSWHEAINQLKCHSDFPIVFVGDQRCNGKDEARLHTNLKPYGHPSAIVHEFWAKNIGDWLESKITVDNLEKSTSEQRNTINHNG